MQIMQWTNQNTKQKHATGAMRGKTCDRCQARENMRMVSRAGKHATVAKLGKTCDRCQARKHMRSLPSAGKLANGAKRGKTHESLTIGWKSNMIGWSTWSDDRGKRLMRCGYDTTWVSFIRVWLWHDNRKQRKRIKSSHLYSNPWPLRFRSYWSLNFFSGLLCNCLG